MSDTDTWILTDVANDRWTESISLGPDDLGVPGCTVSKRVLRGGLRDGVEIIEVSNGPLTFTVIPTRGMGLWKGDYRGASLGWNAPVIGPVHPKFINLHDRGGLGWLDGFDEWICRCGLESNGAPGLDTVPDCRGNPVSIPLTLHGKIANLPAHYVAVHSDPKSQMISIEGHVDESALFSPSLRMKSIITTRSGDDTLTIADEFVNLGSSTAEIQALYHMNFGPPFLERGSRFLAPVAEVAPVNEHSAQGNDTMDTYLGPTPGHAEQVYFYDLIAGDRHRTLVALQNAAGDKAVVLRFDKEQLPCFTQWKNTADSREGYVTGLEPGTNYPNPRSVERRSGRVVRIEPGACHRSEIEVGICLGRDSVESVRNEIAALQSDRTPVIHETLVPRFC